MLHVGARIVGVLWAAVALASRGAVLGGRARQRAQDLVEYGVIVAVVAVVVLVGIQAFGGGIAALFNRLLVHFAGLG